MQLWFSFIYSITTPPPLPLPRALCVSGFSSQPTLNLLFYNGIWQAYYHILSSLILAMAFYCVYSSINSQLDIWILSKFSICSYSLLLTSAILSEIWVIVVIQFCVLLQLHHSLLLCFYTRWHFSQILPPLLFALLLSLHFNMELKSHKNMPCGLRFLIRGIYCPSEDRKGSQCCSVLYSLFPLVIKKEQTNTVPWNWYLIAKRKKKQCDTIKLIFWSPSQVSLNNLVVNLSSLCWISMLISEKWLLVICEVKQVYLFEQP